MKYFLIATFILIANPARAAHYHHFYENPVFWVAMSCVLVVVFLLRPVSKAVSGGLHARVDAVLKSIQSASALRNDAQRLLEDYRSKQKNVKKEVDILLAGARSDISLLKEEALQKIDEELFAKEKDIASKLSVMQAQAREDVVNIISEKTIENVKQYMAKKQDAKSQEKLVKQAIENL